MTTKHVSEQTDAAVREAVQARYARLALSVPVTQGARCCREVDLYEVETGHLPAQVTDLSLGCGDPITLASLQPGQTVLDLGAGAGIDCFLAAERVGVTGRVIGVDMTPAMWEKANRNRERLGRDNVEFRLGQIEALPVADDSVDVIISNCVINLSPDKPAVFREAYRVLRPGGRLAVSDMVTQGRFSAAERANMDAWSACIAGAEDVADYAGWMTAAGFTDITIREKGAEGINLANSHTPATDAPRLFSALLTAIKP